MKEPVSVLFLRKSPEKFKMEEERKVEHEDIYILVDKIKPLHKNQAPTIKEKASCENGVRPQKMLLEKKGDRQLFLKGRGLSLLVDSSKRKSSLSPLGTSPSILLRNFFLPGFYFVQSSH